MSTNNHIEDYLNHYCNLDYAPGFAVLIKGEWGAGKTWFINKYCDKLKGNNQKTLYTSLYGMSSIQDIDEAFFRLLHPIMSSRGVAITGKIAKALLKGALKIDLNNDNNADGSWSIQIPDIDFPDLKDVDESILIFDDLERCSIELSILLGYVNHFVGNRP
jgi:GTPase SAR1 family protein